MNRYGFIIKDGKVYDTHRTYYQLSKSELSKNVIYYLKPKEYKRLYKFEVLLKFYTTDRVFEILKNNKKIKKARLLNDKISDKAHIHILNMSVVYSYPAKYLTTKDFSIYKVCQKLKPRYS